MNATKFTLALAGSLAALAIAAAPTPRKTELADAGAEPTPYSADHARIDTPAEEQPAQF